MIRPLIYISFRLHDLMFCFWIILTFALLPYGGATDPKDILDRIRKADTQSAWTGREILCSCSFNCSTTSVLHILEEFGIKNACVGHVCVRKKTYVGTSEQPVLKEFHGCLGTPESKLDLDSEMITHCTNKLYESTLCCEKSFCAENVNITTPILEKAKYFLPTSPGIFHSLMNSNTVLVIVLSLVGIGIAAFLVSICLYYFKRDKVLEWIGAYQLEPKVELGEAIPMFSSVTQIDSVGSGAGSCILQGSTLSMKVTLGTEIGFGRFGIVYEGVYSGQRVAVKVFQSRNEQSFTHEVDLYDRLQLRHPNVLLMLGYDLHSANIGIDFWLITEYHLHGSLSTYLDNAPIDERTLLQMIRSLCQGLAYLHSTTTTGSHEKPSIAHCDLKRQNILVKKDLTLAIGDLGLSLADEKRSLSFKNPRCGTARYVAPELLLIKSIANFHTFIYSDLYSLGLVLWEMCRRTKSMTYNASGVEQSISYFECVPRDPSHEDMKRCICDEGLRPRMEPSWFSSPVMVQLIETMRECWSPEPLRRPEAITIRRRVDELCHSHGFIIEQ